MIIQLGQANSFHAVRLQRFVCVVAVGEAPTPGWVNSWRPGIVPNNQIWFSQTPPEGLVQQLVTPFVSCTTMELDSSYESVEVFHLNGDPETVSIIAFEDAELILAAIVQKHLPPRIYLPEHAELENSMHPVLVYKTDEPFITFSSEMVGGDGKTASASTSAAYLNTSQYYERVLGTWESPEICKCTIRRLEIVCTNPHYTATLKVRVGSEQDIAGAISDCLRDATIAAAVAGIVASVVTAGAGFGAAKAAFMPVFTGCLSGKLNDVLSVDVTLDRDCR